MRHSRHGDYVNRRFIAAFSHVNAFSIESKLNESIKMQTERLQFA